MISVSDCHVFVSKNATKIVEQLPETTFKTGIGKTCTHRTGLWFCRFKQHLYVREKQPGLLKPCAALPSG